MKEFIFILLFAVTPIFALADEATTTPVIASSTATITIRSGSTTAFTGIVEIAASTTPPVDIAPSNSTSTVSVPADSLLATLVALDATTTDFDITDLAYFSSFNSFIINCISIPVASTTDCFNWTYAVNGSFPQVGVDHQILNDGDIVFLFFGPPRQTVLSTTTEAIGKEFTATAQSYDLKSGTYVGTPGLTIGVGIPNPDFSFTELATSTSDENGEAIFTMNATGTFSVGIQEDFYFPSVSITIIEIPATTTPETPAPPPSSGGGGGGISHVLLNVSSALVYLTSKQQADGSFDSPLLTDWAAIAFASTESGAAKQSLRNYLLSTTPALSSVTDFERHAMALMALGVNPYSGTPSDYIAPIIDAFDGTQIGDASLDNDDIFALFPLLHAGYGTSDDIIQKTVAFIVSRQQANGAWDSSVDVTAAAIQALSQVTSLPNVGGALTKAEQYLHSQQQSNGGFGNSFSTSWALQAIAALNQSTSSWMPSGYNPNDYLASLQQGDGGLEPTSIDVQTRTWATEYAIPASLGKTWSSLLQSFAKPASATGSVGGAVLGASTSTVATTTSPTATSTPEIIATSTSSIVTIESTTASTSSPQAATAIPPKIKKVVKKIAPPQTTQPATPTTSTPISQTAAAASSPNNFFAKLWHAVAYFFSFLF